MQDVKVESFPDYRLLLEATPTEFGHLFDTILINVTAFFRDPSVWEYIRQEIVPRVIEARGSADPIRIWTTGCSTGEEAYSVAMVFADALGDDDFKQRVKIYATDVDDGALQIGRHAIYDPTSLEAVPDDFRDRFFETVNDHVAFRADLRRSVISAGTTSCRTHRFRGSTCSSRATR